MFLLQNPGTRAVGQNVTYTLDYFSRFSPSAVTDTHNDNDGGCVPGGVGTPGLCKGGGGAGATPPLPGWLVGCGIGGGAIGTFGDPTSSDRITAATLGSTTLSGSPSSADDSPSQDGLQGTSRSRNMVASRA
jgi:hypothetical protein